MSASSGAVIEAQESRAPSSRRTVDHSNGVWSGLFTIDGRRHVESFLLDQATFARDRESFGLSERQTANWTLGMGEDSARFETLAASSRWQKNLKNHRLAITLGLEGSQYVGSSAFQDLEAQYLLLRQEANRGEAFSRALDRSLEWGSVLGLEDVYRASSSLDLRINAEQRHNRFEFQDQRRDTSDLLSAGAGFSKRWNRTSWDTDAQRSQLVFRNEGLSAEPRSEQGLASVTSTVSTAVAAKYRMGAGYQSFSSTFSKDDARTVHGPVLTLARQSDGRFAWEARVSLLKEDGNAAREGQSFGSFTGSLRLTPRANLVLSLSKEVDLLRSYENASSTRLVLDSEQQYTILQSAQYELLGARSRWSLLYVRSAQRFDRIRVDNASLSSSWTWRISRVSEMLHVLELRRDQEREADGSDSTGVPGATRGRREVIKSALSYRYRWGGGSRLLEGRPYASIGLDAERLEEGELGLAFTRISLLLGLGQEWSL